MKNTTAMGCDAGKTNRQDVLIGTVAIPWLSRFKDKSQRPRFVSRVLCRESFVNEMALFDIVYYPTVDEPEQFVTH